MGIQLRRLLLAVAAFAAASGLAHAQLDHEATPKYDRAAPEVDAVLAPGHLFSRNPIDLSGEWRYLLDPMRAGLRRPSSRRDFANDRTPSKEDLIEYEWATSPTLTVPGDWNTQAPELFWFDSLVWHHRKIEAATKRGKRYFLYFEGANYWTRAFLNGAALGDHEGGFTPFSFEVTGKLLRGDNTLVVAVDSEHGAESVPSFYFDWLNYGGITRPVHLIETPATFIRDFTLALDPANADTLAGSAMLDGPKAANARVAFSIPSLGWRQESRTDATGRAAFTAPAPALDRWTPSAPTLYEVRIEAAGDAVAEKIGFRTIAVQGTDILLNGAPVFLKGVSLHEERIGEKAGRRIDDSDARALLQTAKDLGANFVRLAHYPHNQRTLRLADEMGLLVWSEIPVYWEEIRYTNPKTLAVARRTLKEMIARDANRAAVVIWGVANETPITPERNAFLETLIADVRAQDPTRLVSAALNKTKNDGAVFVIEDPLAAKLDLLAVNVYEGWYGDRTIDDVPALEWRTPYDKPLIFSEFGADALAGHRGGRLERYTEEHQVAYYRATLAMADKVPFLRGLSPWVLKDFRSPRRWHGRFQNHWNRKGLIDENGVRKDAFDVIREYYALRH